MFHSSIPTLCDELSGSKAAHLWRRKPILAMFSVFGFLALSQGDCLYWHCTIGILNLYGGSLAGFFPSSGFPRIHLVSLVSLFIYVLLLHYITA